MNILTQTFSRFLIGILAIQAVAAITTLKAHGQASLPELPAYNFSTIASFGSSTGSLVTVTAINDFNQYVGNVNSPGYPGGTLQGFLASDGSILSIADPGAFTSPNSSGVYGITDTGKVLGTVGYNSAGQGFLYDIASETYTTLPTPSGRPNFGAFGISSSGNNVVGRAHYSSGVDVAYEYTNGTFSQLNVPGTFTYAYGVNNSGYIVGDYYPDGGTSGSDSVGYLLSPSGNLTPINISGAAGVTAMSINDKNIVIGNFESKSQNGFGFLETTNGTFYQVQFPEAVDTALSGINNNGVLTGTYSTDDHVIIGNGNHSSLRALGYFYQ